MMCGEEDANLIECASYQGGVITTGASISYGSYKFGKWINQNNKPNPTNTKIGATGQLGVEFLAKTYPGESQKFFTTSKGGRYIDQYYLKGAQRIGMESKVGYQSLTETIKTQVLKDVELVSIGRLDTAEWHFFKSPVTGKVGGSQPLLNFLTQNNIKYVIH